MRDLKHVAKRIGTIARRSPLGVSSGAAQECDRSPVVSPFAVSEMRIESTPSRRRCPCAQSADRSCCHDPAATRCRPGRPGDHRLRTGPVANVGTVAALDGMLRVAEVLSHLDLEAGRQDLLRQAGQQPSSRRDQPRRLGLARRAAPRSTGPVDYHWSRSMAAPPSHLDLSLSVLPSQPNGSAFQPDQ